MAGFTLPIALPLSWTSARTAQFWAGQDRHIYARFYASRPDGVTWEDLTSYLVSARVSLGNVADVGTGNSGVDTGVRQATFELINDRPTVDSLHPRDRTSSWNQWCGVYAPLLWPTREVILEVAAVPVGVTPSDADWVRVFHGFMGDSISASSDNGRIAIECRDLMKRLQSAYIETVREYGSEAGTPAETVMQQIINDNVAQPPTLYVPVSPGFMIKPYKVEYQSVADALWQIANQFGGWIGYKWIPDYNDFRLTLLIPPRGKDAASADWAFDGRQIIVQHLDISDRDVRNAVVITYRDSATGTRQSVTVEDAASIGEFGRIAMQIEEADTSLIDTPTEATALAQVVVHDLKDLTAATRINTPLIPTMDIFDGILVTNPRLSSTQDFYAVESVEHVLDFDRGQFRTEVVASDRVVGAHTRWLLMETRPSANRPPLPPVSGAVPKAPRNLRVIGTGLETVEQTTYAYVDLAWDPVVDVPCDYYQLRCRKASAGNWQTMLVPLGTDSTPQRMRALIGNTSYEFAVAGYSRAGVLGLPSGSLTVTTPKDAQAPATPTFQDYGGIVKGIYVVMNVPAEPDWDGFEIHVSTAGSGFTPDASTLKAKGRQTRFEITGLIPSQTYYVKAIAYDTSGNKSAPAY